MTPQLSFDGLVHTPQCPRQRPSGLDEAEARPVTMPAGAPDDTPAPSPSIHVPLYLQPTIRFFKRNAGVWISALDLERVSGRLSWRTRVSECRTMGGMKIINRVRRGQSVHPDGSTDRWCVSEYRYEP